MLFVCILGAAFAFCAAVLRWGGSPRPFLRAALSVCGGLAALFAVNLLSGLTGVRLPAAPLSIAGAAFLGIPGVILMLLLQCFFS